MVVAQKPRETLMPGEVAFSDKAAQCIASLL